MIAIGVPAEDQDEPRIGLTPETVKKLVKAGASVTIRARRRLPVPLFR